MMKKSLKSNSDRALTVGGGGLSDQIPQPLPSQSLAQAETLTQSSALAQLENTSNFTHPGNQPLSSGNKPVLTDKSESTIPNSTLAGTVNWALNMLQKRGLIIFGLVRGANENYYQARFSTSAWKVENGVLTLKGETK